MYKALHATCVIKKHKDQDKKDSKIIIPDSAHYHNIYRKTEVCEVISVGRDSKFKDTLAKGDYVLCHKGEGVRINKDKDMYVMKDKWVYAKVDKDFEGGTFHEQN